nr:MAG TPA: hypothetical protein [Caudoviricetes sp.]
MWCVCGGTCGRRERFAPYKYIGNYHAVLLTHTSHTTAHAVKEAYTHNNNPY